MATTKLSSAEIEGQALVGMIDYPWAKGVSAATSELLGASRHPPMRIIRAAVMLTEVADASATTITVKLQNNGTDMTDTLTFTQGTEAVGAVKRFTITANQDVIAKASAFTAVVAGTTATLGEVLIMAQFENV